MAKTFKNVRNMVKDFKLERFASTLFEAAIHRIVMSFME